MANEYDNLTEEEIEIHKRLDQMIDITKPLMP